MSWRRFFIGSIFSLLISATFLVFLFAVFLLQSKIQVFNHSNLNTDKNVVPFPVSVNIKDKTIIENPEVDSFFYNSLAEQVENRKSWWNKILALFEKDEWYQNMASPVSRIVVIWPGERKEEIANNFGLILGWDSAQKGEFLNLIDTASPILKEGKYFPQQYITHKDVPPRELASLVLNSFNSNVISRYSKEVEEAVPFKEALIIASLIEREASDFENMREVSGVIWNRIFKDMPLQLDATLQYAKGSRQYESAWWPQINPNDKFLKSPYNTYQNPGLPPAPISNPSIEAIVAALNPIVTDCLFYFHTNNGEYFCSQSYQQHVSKLRSIYGKGS